MNQADPLDDWRFLRGTIQPLMMKGEPLRMVDLFCGCGGLSLGVAEACRVMARKFNPVLALDNDPISLEVYRRNFPCDWLCSSDINEAIDGKVGSPPTLKERLVRRIAGEPDLLLAGPPCQGYSDLNNHTRRNDPRNELYERVARFVEIVRPKNIIIENVSTAIHGKEKAVQKTIELLLDLGFEVDSRIVDLSTIGVPQKRRRHVVIASVEKKVSLQVAFDHYNVLEPRSVWWAIGDLVDKPASSVFNSSSNHSPENIERIQYLHDMDLYDLPDDLRPDCHKNGNHSYKSMYGRLRPDRPAQTITSGFGCPGQGRFVHPSQPRTLTPHEAARLQFFPDYFDFSTVTRRTSLACMISNAAPMKLSYVLCREMFS